MHDARGRAAGFLFSLGTVFFNNALQIIQLIVKETAK